MVGQDGFLFLFLSMKFICIDGKMVDDSEPLLMYNNRSFRYGDGLFETMKMIDGRIVLKEFHFERLFNSLSLLNYETPVSFTVSVIENLIERLALMNECRELCRIRLTIFRGNGNLYPVAAHLNYIIECNSLTKTVNSFNEAGLIIDVFQDARKACDRFSNIKSANFLPYVLAGIHAQQYNLDDCLVLNSNGNIADSTIANVFAVKGTTISTPALTEGCINGVMRRHLLQNFKENGYSVTEKEITINDTMDADELFLTNSINGIRWVKKSAGKEYTCAFTQKIYKEFIAPIFA